MFAKNFLRDVDEMINLRNVVITGCCTDICDLNLAIPLKNYFNEYNREVDIYVPEKAVETYDAPNHNRDEYNEMAFKLMNQSGIKLVKRYERNGK
jgi:nicotinamidase-related amidase